MDAQPSIPPDICLRLMERSPVPMAKVEGTGHVIQYVNSAFCHLVAKNRSALLRRPFAEIVQEGDPCLAILDRVYRTGDFRTHTELEQAKSHPSYWSYAIWPVLDAKDQVVGLMMQVTETTAFHQQTTAMNQALLRSSLHQHELTEMATNQNEELERRVLARTYELEQLQDRLRILATELNLAEQRERTRIAAELHDYLAQLLVLGCLTLGQAKRAELSPRAAYFVQETEETLGKALTYCRTLMAELNPPVLQQHGLGPGLVWLGNHMKRQGVEVTVDIPEVSELALPEDRAVLLFQSIRELLINVAKHAPIKRAMVRMTVEEDGLRLVVRDENGFDLASASSGPTTTMSSKFGLFSIGQRMKTLGGTFDIQTAPGQGTLVTLGLPLTPVGWSPARAGDSSPSSGLSLPAGESQPPSDDPAQVEPDTNRIRVLLVDDHTVLREGLRSIVSAYAHLQVVGEAGDGLEAVELAQRLLPDVVVMDINMPRMNGIDATSRIKTKWPGIEIIGLSVNQSGDTEEKMKAAGAAAYLTKESAVDVLCQVIQDVMAHKPLPNS
jgi:signal transduction histidine kinase/ActR/RegA family two-component response regulator